ncbi:hypothetical protein RN001_003039 [Aquatica leii]|uniref:Uncharacterized protein n=1 Tax=Aquatica leii TaxID=1421715 RepID=A0AAN7SRG3_9COLE|nr:hypothetical protein RN001_003039 [Aquatica leii]
MPKSRLPISQRKRSRSKRAKTVKHLWCLRKENQPDVIPTMTDNEPSTSNVDRSHSPILLQDLEDVWNIKSTTGQTNKDPWGSDTEYDRIVAEELQIEVDQPEEPAISGKRIVSIGFLEQVIQLSENHARLVHDAVPVNYKSGQLLHENLLNSGIGVIKSPEKLTLRKNGPRKCYRNSNPDSGLSAHFFVEDTAQSPERLTTSVNTQNIEALMDMRTPTKIKRCREISVSSYQQRIQKLQRKVASKNAVIVRLKKKVVNITVASANSNLLSLAKSKSVRVFINMQLHRKRGNPWKEEEKQLALSLYYKSPSMYLFMRNTLKFFLPKQP